MKITSFFIGATLMVVATTVSAADLNSTKVITLTNVNGVYSNDFGNNFTASQNGKTFLDTYNFVVSSVSDLDALVSSFATVSRGQTTLDLNITSFDLYSGSVKIASTDMSDPEWFSTGRLDLRVISDITNLQTGNYSLLVGGTVLGSLGGSYSGTINVSPVPEPETWGLTMAGLAAVGAAARRRARKSAPNAIPA